MRRSDVVVIAAMAVLLGVVALWADWSVSAERSAREAADRVHNLALGYMHDHLLPGHVDVGERITQLPDDGKAYHLSVFVHDNWREIPTDRQLVAWFSVEPRLASLKAQTHDHLFTASSPEYKTKFAKAMPVLPGVMIQDAGGVVKYSAALNHPQSPLPSSAAELGERMQRLLQGCRPFCQPQPEPEPEPQPKVEPTTTNLPEVPMIALPEEQKEPEKEEISIPVGLFAFVSVVVMAAFAGIAALYNVKRHKP